MEVRHEEDKARQNLNYGRSIITSPLSLKCNWVMREHSIGIPVNCMPFLGEYYFLDDKLNWCSPR